MAILKKAVMSILLYSISSSVLAVSGFLDVIISGEILAPTCIVNNGQTIEVDFQDVLTTRIENENYQRKLEYTLSCKNANNPGLTLKINGGSSLFDARYLKTTIDDLAISFKAGDQAFSIKDKVRFNYKNPPDLYATLVKKSGASLTTGGFEATATLQIEYQ